jgi:hypothetical protein
MTPPPPRRVPGTKHAAIAFFRRLVTLSNRARFGDPLQSRGDVDAVAHEVAVGLPDDVAEVSADAKLDATPRRQANGLGIIPDAGGVQRLP